MSLSRSPGTPGVARDCHVSRGGGRHRSGARAHVLATSGAIQRFPGRDVQSDVTERSLHSAERHGVLGATGRRVDGHEPLAPGHSAQAELGLHFHSECQPCGLCCLTLRLSVCVYIMHALCYVMFWVACTTMMHT